MLSAARSFTDPPGLHHSALPQNSMLGNSPPARSSRSNGVLPICSRSDAPARPPTPAPLCDKLWSTEAINLRKIPIHKNGAPARSRERQRVYSELDATAHLSDIPLVSRNLAASPAR